MARARCATAMDAMATAAQAIPLLGLVMLGMRLLIRARHVPFVELVNTRRLRATVHALRALPTTLDAALHLLVFAMQASAAQMLV